MLLRASGKRAENDFYFVEADDPETAVARITSGLRRSGMDTSIDEVGIHDDLTLGRLPEYFGEAHHCFSLNGRTAAR
jgi:hypothetical protein